MKDGKCKNCGASFRPADKFCSYCGSVRQGQDEKPKPEEKDKNEIPNNRLKDEFKKMGLNSSVLDNLFGSIFED